MAKPLGPKSSIGLLLKETIGPFLLMITSAVTITVAYTTIGTSRLTVLAEAIAADIKNPAVHVRVAGRSLILEGTLTDPAESDRAEAIAIDHLASQKSSVFFGATGVVNLITTGS